MEADCATAINAKDGRTRGKETHAQSKDRLQCPNTTLPFSQNDAMYPHQLSNAEAETAVFLNYAHVLADD